MRFIKNQRIILTEDMTLEKALAWVDVAAITNQFGRDANWGLYTKYEKDAFAITCILGYGQIPIQETVVGYYPHFHVPGHNYFNKKI